MIAAPAPPRDTPQSSWLVVKADLQAKMDEYMANGAQRGWLIAPETRTVYIYHPAQPAVTRENAATLSGDLVLPGLTLELALVWPPDL